MIVKGTTANGFNYEYDNSIFGDWEIMDWLTEMLELQEIPDEERTIEENTLLMRDMYAIIRKVFTRSQIASWKNVNKDEGGNIIAERMWEDFREMFFQSEDKDTKNS